MQHNSMHNAEHSDAGGPGAGTTDYLAGLHDQLHIQDDRLVLHLEASQRSQLLRAYAREINVCSMMLRGLPHPAVVDLATQACVGCDLDLRSYSSDDLQTVLVFGGRRDLQWLTALLQEGVLSDDC